MRRQRVGKPRAVLLAAAGRAGRSLPGEPDEDEAVRGQGGAPDQRPHVLLPGARRRPQGSGKLCRAAQRRAVRVQVALHELDTVICASSRRDERHAGPCARAAAPSRPRQRRLRAGEAASHQQQGGRHRLAPARQTQLHPGQGGARALPRRTRAQAQHRAKSGRACHSRAYAGGPPSCAPGCLDTWLFMSHSSLCLFSGAGELPALAGRARAAPRAAGACAAPAGAGSLPALAPARLCASSPTAGPPSGSPPPACAGTPAETAADTVPKLGNSPQAQHSALAAGQHAPRCPQAGVLRRRRTSDTGCSASLSGSDSTSGSGSGGDTAASGTSRSGAGSMCRLPGHGPALCSGRPGSPASCMGTCGCCGRLQRVRLPAHEAGTLLQMWRREGRGAPPRCSPAPTAALQRAAPAATRTAGAAGRAAAGGRSRAAARRRGPPPQPPAAARGVAGPVRPSRQGTALALQGQRTGLHQRHVKAPRPTAYPAIVPRGLTLLPKSSCSPLPDDLLAAL